MTLDYRSPHTREHRVQTLVNQMTQDEAVDWLLTAGKVIFGFPLSLIAPLFLTGMLKLVIPLGERGLFLNSYWLFAVVSALLVPLLVAIANMISGQMLWEWLVNGSRDKSYLINPGRWSTGQVPAFALLIDIPLFGPRLLQQAMLQFSALPAIDAPLRTTAALIIFDLAQAGRAVPARELVSPARSLDEVKLAVAYLRRIGWVSPFTGGDRVFLTLTLRKHAARNFDIR